MGGQFFGGGSGGGGTPGDAPGGAAGGDLSGTYPNPGVANLNGVAAASYALLAGPTFTGTVTLPAGTVTSGMILDGTIVSADLNAAAGITSAQLAGSIAPSKVTGTAVTAADTGTVTSAMILDGTIADADVSATAGIGGGKVNDREFYLGGGTFVRMTGPREAARDATAAAPTSGVMMSSAIVLYKGDVITNVTFVSGTTAAVTPTHWWFALYDTQATPALIAQTADQTSTAWAASTIKTLALGSPAPYTVTTSGVHWISVMVAAATVPTMCGEIIGTTMATGILNQKVLGVTSGSSLTTTAPGTIASPAARTGVTWGAVS